MRTIVLAAIAPFLLLAFNASATEITRHEKAFCTRNSRPGTAQKELLKQSNRLSFNNHGGLLNAGVCWWHSRFTRKALYLAIFRPDLPRPTSSEEAAKIIKDIRMGRVTVVPGYSNLREFSRDFATEIQDRLEKWQIGDGFLRQQWTVGLWGSPETSKEKLKERMDDLYEEVAVRKNVTYQMLQLRGVDAHAWLVVGMTKKRHGYTVYVIDSNYSSIQSYTYTNGDSYLYYPYFGRFVPITGKRRELKRIKRAAQKFCDKID